MTFTTPAFIIFLVVVYALYWNLRRRGQNLLILTSSLFFYGWWDWRFLFLLAFNAGVDFFVALALEKTDDPTRRRRLLLISLISNLGVLGFFKYANFFIGSFTAAFDALGMRADAATVHVILPIGISFFTFQALSYTIDVYRRQTPVVHDAVEYFSFITFFPHMIAGPIQQAKHFLVQFHRDREFDWHRSSDGARQMLWGFFKKMVIADSLSPIVDAIYNNPHSASGAALMWATFCFAFQIYCDFSGYTDIAIGCARLFDLNMTRNFAYPYFARSIPEFWRRWHISLTTWFRDYLYIPMGGNRVSKVRTSWNVIVVFVASGFWHGANWTFVIWGLLHGVYFLLWRKPADKGRDKIPGGDRFIPSPSDLLAILVTFALTCFAWIFFRANSVSDAFLVVGKVGAALAHGRLHTHLDATAALLITLLVAIEWCQRQYPHPLYLNRWPRPARWAVYYLVVGAILLFAPLGNNPFIYFQF